MSSFSIDAICRDNLWTASFRVISDMTDLPAVVARGRNNPRSSHHYHTTFCSARKPQSVGLFDSASEPLPEPDRANASCRRSHAAERLHRVRGVVGAGRAPDASDGVCPFDMKDIESVAKYMPMQNTR